MVNTLLSLAFLLSFPGPARAEEAPWYEQPVATELRPVQPDSIAWRWHRSMNAAMAGPGASSLFRPTASRMDVQLRLAEFDGQMPYMSRGQQWRTVELALTGAGIGWQVTADDLLDRNDDLASARRIVRTVISPGIRVEKRDDGTSIDLDEEPRSSAVAEAELTDPAANRHEEGEGRIRRPRPTLSTGFTSSIVSAVDPTLGGSDVTEEQPPEEEEDTGPFRLATRSFVQVENAGLDALRLQVTGRPEPGFEAWALDWAAIGRQELHPRVALIGELRGGIPSTAQPNARLKPRRYGAAIDTQVNPAKRWVVRTAYSRLHRNDGRIEKIAEVQLRVNTAWRLPWSVEAGPRGQVPGAPGRWLPYLPESGPIALAPVVRAPAERVAGVTRGEPPPPDADATAAADLDEAADPR